MGIKIGCIFLSILLYKNVEAKSRIDPLVQTNVGLIRGLRASDGDYSMFLGIPYGKVDRANPFGPSTSFPEFDETFEAYDDTAICPQIEEFENKITGSLDCLHLNIYVPSTANSKNRLPVLVWIYGGGFQFGFGGRTLYGPKYLVRHDVILVTVNYRVGPYGFLCLDVPEVPGNQGFKDQLLAFRWIQNNIADFGGDVNKITLFGESAGSISVDAHLYSKQEKLFNNVIMESGTMLVATLPTHINLNAAIKLAEQLGLNVNDTSQALSLLSEIETDLVIAAAAQMDSNYFTPCIEKDFEKSETFLKDYPINLNQPKVKNMPVLIGFNTDEWFSYYVNKHEDDFKNFNGIYDKLAQGFNFEEDYLLKMEEIVRHFYIGDKSFGVDVKYELGQFDSDIKFIYPTERSIDKYIDNGASKVFYYVFSYVGDRNWVRVKNNITEGGALHADEIGYLFDISFWKENDVSTADQLIIDRMTTMWTNFVKYGDPTPETTELLPVKWEPIVSKDTHYFLNIDSELQVGKRPYHDRVSFWELFYDVNKKFQKGYVEKH